MRDRICLQAYLVGIIAIVGTTIVVFVLVPLINPEVHGSIPEMLVFKERSFKDGVVTELDARYRARAGEANEVSKEKIAVVACTKSMPEWKTLDQSDPYWNTFARAAVVKGFDTGIETKVSFHKVSGSIPFNSALQLAFDDGFQYFVRVNDDTQFVSTGWVPLALEALGSFDPPNVGIVGPTHSGGKTSILTHDMTHRTHLKIFTDYYPKKFRNWYVDDWITYVYGPQRTKKLTAWTVKHLLIPMRYKPHSLKRKDINSTIEQGSKQIERWIEMGCYHPSVNDSKCDAQFNK
eukprot:GHVN01018675.1.p1 GENE.GHVN01018675.1~~GHVN01018675.1.p1  ORF type:complete len:292 (-),score=31.96 GHVN01018675.1:689-1564(-)